MKTGSGFTLLELAIVLVVIGLVAGGITVGSRLLHNSKIRSVSTQLDAAKTAMNTFYLKYNAWPGDMDRASQYWPGCDAVPANCDGDNNKEIEPPDDEDIRGWQHLSLAKLIPDAMTGLSGGATKFVLGSNVPATDIDNAGLWLRYYQFTSDGRAGNMIILSGSEPGTTLMEAPVISPKDAALIDHKLDDGLALTGRMRGRNGVLSGASTGGCISGIDYLPTSDAIKCRLYFMLD
jgi:prepilin-type N-terminal cleavage/methylation domain-containing protein